MKPENIHDLVVMVGTIIMIILIGWFALNSGWGH